MDGGARRRVARDLRGSDLLRCGIGSSGASGVLLRGLLGELLPTTQNVAALAIDSIPEARRWFATGMERTQQENLLLALALPHARYRLPRPEFGVRLEAPPALRAGCATKSASQATGVVCRGRCAAVFSRRSKTAELRKSPLSVTQPAEDASCWERDL